MPSESPQAAFPELYETFADGRLTNVYYRREQLARLRQALIDSQQGIIAAIVQDQTGVSQAEAFVELYMAIAAIKKYHDDLNPANELAAEYSIANGKDALGLRGAVGIVSIIPQYHSLLYSLAVPLSAAIAAGNCVVVVLEKTLQSLPPLLETAIRSSLDPDIFTFAPLSTLSGLSGAGYIAVVQNGESPVENQPNVLLSQSTQLSIAVVDRTADIEASAEALVDARMQFGGRSPYAPDIVLVNEFVKTEFLQAVVKHAITYMTGSDSVVSPELGQNAMEKKTVPNIPSQRERQPAKGIKTITSGANVSIFDVVDRSSASSIGKVTERALYVHAIRSLDDAIETANDLSSGNAAAVYAFGDLTTCKYLLQFVGSEVGFANHFPKELLVGPVVPRGKQPSDIAVRYGTDLFSSPQPRLIQKTELSRKVDRLLDGVSAAGRLQQQYSLMKDLHLEDRAPVRHIEGYFESAALVGLATIATPVLAGIGYLTFVGIRKAVAVALR